MVDERENIRNDIIATVKSIHNYYELIKLKGSIDNFLLIQDTFERMVINGLNTIEKSIIFLNEPNDIKTSTLLFVTGLETIVKARLFYEDWSFVVKEVKDSNKPITTCILEGDFNSISIRESFEKLDFVLNTTNKYYKQYYNQHFGELVSKRNVLVHFDVSDQNDLIDIHKALINSWYFLNKLLTKDWSKVFYDFSIEIDNIDRKMIEDKELFFSGQKDFLIKEDLKKQEKSRIYPNKPDYKFKDIICSYCNNSYDHNSNLSLLAITHHLENGIKKQACDVCGHISLYPTIKLSALLLKYIIENQDDIESDIELNIDNDFHIKFLEGPITDYYPNLFKLDRQDYIINVNSIPEITDVLDNELPSKEFMSSFDYSIAKIDKSNTRSNHNLFVTIPFSAEVSVSQDINHNGSFDVTAYYVFSIEVILIIENIENISTLDSESLDVQYSHCQISLSDFDYSHMELERELIHERIQEQKAEKEKFLSITKKEIDALKSSTRIPSSFYNCELIEFDKKELKGHLCKIPRNEKTYFPDLDKSQKECIDYILQNFLEYHGLPTKLIPKEPEMENLTNDELIVYLKLIVREDIKVLFIWEFPDSNNYKIEKSQTM